MFKFGGNFNSIALMFLLASIISMWFQKPGRGVREGRGRKDNFSGLQLGGRNFSSSLAVVRLGLTATKHFRIAGSEI